MSSHVVTFRITFLLQLLCYCLILLDFLEDKVATTFCFFFELFGALFFFVFSEFFSDIFAVVFDISTKEVPSLLSHSINISSLAVSNFACIMPVEEEISENCRLARSKEEGADDVGTTIPAKDDDKDVAPAFDAAGSGSDGNRVMDCPFSPTLCFMNVSNRLDTLGTT